MKKIMLSVMLAVLAAASCSMTGNRQSGDSSAAETKTEQKMNTTDRIK